MVVVMSLHFVLVLVAAVMGAVATASPSAQPRTTSGGGVDALTSNDAVGHSIEIVGPPAQTVVVHVRGEAIVKPLLARQGGTDAAGDSACGVKLSLKSGVCVCVDVSYVIAARARAAQHQSARHSHSSREGVVSTK